MCEFTDDELDQLFLNVELGEPETNVVISIPHVRLLATVGSPTDEPDNRASLVLTKGGQRGMTVRGRLWPKTLPLSQSHLMIIHYSCGDNPVTQVGNGKLIINLQWAYGNELTVGFGGCTHMYSINNDMYMYMYTVWGFILKLR